MPSLNLLAAVAPTGYGVTGFNVLKILDGREWNVALFPKGNSPRPTPEEQAIVTRCFNRGKIGFDYDAPCLQIWHQFDLAHSVGRGKYVGFPIFELDSFADYELHHLKYPDELVVTSEWAKNILSPYVGSHTHVVPLGYDPSIFNPLNFSPPQKDTTVFFNAGKWEVRKGHDILLDVFQKAFTKDDDVALWLMPHNHFLKPNEKAVWENMYKNSTLGKAGKIAILPWQETQEQVAGIMVQTTCGVFPSRAEGWNLELLEMMAMGKQVIATNYSAHTEFCNSENALLVETPNREDAYDGKWFLGNHGQWASLEEDEIDQMVEHMRAVHKQNQECPTVNLNGISSAQQFTWEKTVDKLVGVLDG